VREEGAPLSRFDVARFGELRRARGLALGDPLVAVALTGSTNDDAMAAARAGARDGATFVADEQSRGRGRHGARWASPPGENLLCSIVLRRGLAPERAGTLTLAVGLALRDAVQPRVQVPIRIKWPNDLYANDRKLAGILLESQLQAGKVEVVVAGIGLNVAMRALPDEIAGVATSLALCGATSLEREVLLADVLEAIERRLEAHVARGLGPVLDELRAHDALLGRRVRSDEVRGQACGISDAGALLIRDDRGRVHALRSGSVSLEP
jgi:BirA family biotin operon repressor/biotin-[acetyl-CoA-carboxylase] ligase